MPRMTLGSITSNLNKVNYGVSMMDKNGTITLDWKQGHKED